MEEEDEGEWRTRRRKKKLLLAGYLLTEELHPPANGHPPSGLK